MKNKTIIFLVILSIISGCARVPKLENSEIEKVNDILVTESKNQNLEFTNENWWTIYEDNHLNKLVDTIMASNIDLELATINIEKAKEGVQKIKGAKMPTAELYGTAKRLKVEDSSPNGLKGERVDILSGGFLFNYDLDLFHKVDSIQKSKESLVKAKKLQTDLITLQITTLTTELYGNYIYLEKVNKNLQSRLELLNQITLMIKQGINAGWNIENDLLNIETNINNIKFAIEKNNLNKSTTLETLNLLSAYKNTKEIKELMTLGSQDSKIIETKLPVPSKIASTVVSNRPDVRYYLMLIEAQNYKLKSLKSDYYPQFSITGNLNQTNLDFRNGFSPSALAWSLGPKVYLPLFNMSQIDSNYKIGGLDLESFVKEYNKTLMTSFKNINIELAAKKAATVEENLKEKNLKNSNKILEDKKLEFKVGEISKYSLIYEKYNNLVIKLEKEQSNYQSYKNQVSLINSLGGTYKNN